MYSTLKIRQSRWVHILYTPLLLPVGKSWGERWVLQYLWSKGRMCSPPIGNNQKVMAKPCGEMKKIWRTKKLKRPFLMILSKGRGNRSAQRFRYFLPHSPFLNSRVTLLDVLRWTLLDVSSCILSILLGVVTFQIVDYSRLFGQWLK